MYSRVIAVRAADRQQFYNVTGLSKKRVMKFADDVARTLISAVKYEDCKLARELAEREARRTAARRNISLEALTEREARKLIAEKRYVTTYRLQ